MPRVKTGTTRRKRHKKILKKAKGYDRSKNRVFKYANQQVMKSLTYSYRDRKRRKRDFRKLWITRISAACRQNDFSYNKLIHGLKNAGVQLNRKMLSDLAVNDAEAFKELVDIARKNA